MPGVFSEMTRKTMLPYSHQHIDDHDIEMVVNALRADRITTGPLVDKFERKVADYCGAKYAVAVSSGTAALHTACYAAGIRQGDEVITSPMTFFGTVASIMYCQGTPVLVDIGDDGNVDPRAVGRAITSSTKAIMPVDYAGQPCDLDVIMEFAAEKGLVVIEDACHALGATYKGRRIGSIADMTVFSFHPVKAITTGEGGMVLTDNEDYYATMRRFRSHNIERDPEDYWIYDIKEPGYNYRLTDIQAALGISQIGKLDEFIERRRDIASRYDAAFGHLHHLWPVTMDTKDSQTAHHLYVVLLKRGHKGWFMRELIDRNIGVQVHYIPVHCLTVAKRLGYWKGDFPDAEEFHKEAVSLPIFPSMTAGDVDDVIEAVLEVLKEVTHGIR